MEVDEPMSQIITRYVPTKRARFSQARSGSTSRSRSRSRSAKRPSVNRSATPGRFAASEGLSQMMSQMVRNVAAPSPFPRTARKTLRYADTLLMTSSSGAAFYQVFRLNSCFDPDLTGTGHQPYYFDQFCSSGGPYLSYRVLGARVVIEACIDYGTPLPGMIVAGPSISSSTPPRSLIGGEVQPMLELPGWTGMQLSPNSPLRKLKFQFDIGKLFGVPKNGTQIEEEYEALYNANPADVMFFHICFQAADASSSTQAVVSVMIEYDVKFQNVASVSSS